MIARDRCIGLPRRFVQHLAIRIRVNVADDAKKAHLDRGGRKGLMRSAATSSDKSRKYSLIGSEWRLKLIALVNRRWWDIDATGRNLNGDTVELLPTLP